MKTRLVIAATAVLLVVLASGVLTGSTVSFGPVLAQEEVVPEEPTQNQVAQTRPWSSVGSACAPDDDSPYTRYEAQVSSGYVEFKTNTKGDLYFDCNVTTPIDSYPGEPDWNHMYLTFKDPDASGYVEVKLYRKNLTTGAVATVQTLTSTDGIGVRTIDTSVSGFDFDSYAYFIRARLYRSWTSSDQEFHIVRLGFIIE